MRLCLALAGVLALACSPADADGLDHHHPPEHAELHDRFYRTWMRPDRPGVSCCDRRDCAPVRAVRQVGGQYQAQRDSDGAWLKIPLEKIEQRRDSPDGRSHLCSIGLTVYCFVFGASI